MQTLPRVLRRALAGLILAGLLVGVGGCYVTPHANLGVGLDYSGGSFHLRPHVNVGVWGRP